MIEEAEKLSNHDEIEYEVLGKSGSSDSPV